MNGDCSLVDAMVKRTGTLIADRAGWPEATYRLQFQKGQFGFHDAAVAAAYLQQLGVSHVYASPYLKARAGNPHGYAVVDYGKLDPELGSPEDYQAFVDALGEHGMGQILDMVPNHMSTAPGENAWWTNVLENGPSSPYADFFDIQWRPVKEELRNKVLLPLLGKQFGQALEAGELRLAYRQGAFFVQYFETMLPLDPRTYVAVLTHRIDDLKENLPADSPDLRELESIITAAQNLPGRTETDADRVRERQREKEVVKDRLRRLTQTCPDIAAWIEQNLEQLGGRPGEPESFDLLEKLLDAQVYRLCHWKAASDEINYRRFFDVNELAAVCMEEQSVFEASHAFMFELLAGGRIAGLRIDHVDGLFDPLEYLWRLQWGYIRALGRRAYAEHCCATVPGSEPEETTDRTPSWEEIEAATVRALWPEVAGPSPLELFCLSPADPAESDPASLAPRPPDPEASGPAPGAFSIQHSALSIQHPGPKSPIPNPKSQVLLSSSPFPLPPSAVPLYVIVEKILGPEEPLPRAWPVAGTTGYDFLNFVNGLFVDPDGLREVNKTYSRFTRQSTHFHEVAYRAKLLILRVAMASELQLLAYRLNRISEQHRLSRDFTLNTLRTALREVLACFPVYRTYVGPGGVEPRDREIIHRAVARARRRNPAIDASVFDFISGVLLLEQPPNLDAAGLREREFFVGRFQQVTSPVMAKGVEDTAFYRHYPLCSTNEVGGEPARAAVSVEQFHHENQCRQQEHPGAMICTSTHDTKRSEDVRARISVLSEIPGEWRKAINRWARLNRRHRRDVEGEPAPSRNDEYLFYQTLVGIWPLEPPDDQGHAELVDRLIRYMQKATHEAKLHTSWISPDPDYDEAVQYFVRAALDKTPKNRFLPDFRQFHERVVDCGLYTALSQVFLKLTSPGVPDIYQGQELWGFYLVDPDNRGPVDFSLRMWLLGELQGKAARGGESLLELAQQLGSSPRDTRLKLFVTWRCLQFRRRHKELLRTGQYVALGAQGNRARHVCAFAWQSAPSSGRATDTVIAVAPRLLGRLCRLDESERLLSPTGPAAWQDTALAVPKSLEGTFQNWFTGQTLAVREPAVPLSAVLGQFPVALLARTA
jgi:(1->4)-alpha-D-glucan 1-alpha-D-glucosylmutase